MSSSFRTTFEAIAGVKDKAETDVTERIGQTMLQVIIKVGNTGEEGGNILTFDEIERFVFQTGRFYFL